MIIKQTSEHFITLIQLSLFINKFELIKNTKINKEKLFKLMTFLRGKNSVIFKNCVFQFL